MTPDEFVWFEGAWIFAGICLVIGFAVVRLLFRERITLQGSMSFSAFLAVLGAMAIFPNATATLAHWLGFTLLSNFFFFVAIALLAILHLRALVTLSKVHLRTITLTQEVAILQERLEAATQRRGLTSRTPPRLQRPD
jgi:hypothetical protein